MARIARFFLVLLSLVCLTNAAFLWFNSSPNLGLYALTAFGVLALLYAILFRGMNRLLDNRAGTVVKALVLLSLSLHSLPSPAAVTQYAMMKLP